MLEKTTGHKILTLIGTLLAGFSLATIIWITNPDEASLIVYISLYLSIFLFITGTVTLLGLMLRHRFSKGLYITNLGISIRQGAILATCSIIMLILSSQQLLHWWSSILILASFLSLEIFFNLS